MTRLLVEKINAEPDFESLREGPRKTSTDNPPNVRDGR
jgi:hypothetical protein